MKRAFGIVALLSFAVLFGCGGGGGGSSSDPGYKASLVTVPSESLDGSYVMRGFQVKYSNGTSVTETSPGVTSFSGSMKIVSTSWTQNISFNGISGGGTGVVTITWTNVDRTEGIANVSYPDGGKDVFEVSIDGYRLTVYAYAADSLGNTVEEWDYWEKVLDTAAPVRQDIGSIVDAGSESPGGFPVSPAINLLNR